MWPLALQAVLKECVSMLMLAAALAPGPRAYAQVVLTFSVAQRTLVPLLMDQERASRQVHAREHHIPATARDQLIFNAVLAAASVLPMGSTSANRFRLLMQVVLKTVATNLLPFVLGTLLAL